MKWKLPAARSARKWDGFTPLIKKEDFANSRHWWIRMPVSRHVLEYAVALTTASRPKDTDADDYIRRYVAWGAGPRATQHLVTAAKASALLDGRPTPESADIQHMAVPVLRHRIIPNYNALGEGHRVRGHRQTPARNHSRTGRRTLKPGPVVATLRHPYLDLAAMEALRNVRLRPRGAAEGTFAGPHKSHFRGTAVEFADYREYSPGDDIRLVDWKVFARTDRHYLRLVRCRAESAYLSGGG